MPCGTRSIECRCCTLPIGIRARKSHAENLALAGAALVSFARRSWACSGVCPSWMLWSHLDAWRTSLKVESMHNSHLSPALPKKSLDHLTTPWQSLFPVLNTPPKAAPAPVSLSGFFTSIGFQWSGSAQSYNTLRGKAASGLLAVLKYLTTPQQGGFSTKPKGGHHG